MPPPAREERGDGLPSGTRLTFVADGRSPIARNWIRHFVDRGHPVQVISTFPCDATALPGARVEVVPVALARLAGSGASAPTAGATRGGARALVGRARAAATAALLPTVFGWLAPLDVAGHAPAIRALVRDFAPDLVHAMRIPYEGIAAAQALADEATPLVTSVWGNDLELWAARYPLVARLTRTALQRADALHPDCRRDLHLAETWGWDPTRPAAVVPGNGGVRRALFHRGAPDAAVLARHGIPAGAPLVLNARGMRGYVRNDTFFRAIPGVLARRPDAVFAAVGMRGHPGAQRWVRRLGIADAVRLLPAVSPAEIAELFRGATAAVSPATHDGTPNTLLEAMACGALPVAGDIASVREWIEHGVNGLLFDPAAPDALADALVRALDDTPLRAAAAAHNEALVAARADHATCMRAAERLYADVLARAGAGVR